jgi:hypothetical protein
LGENLRVIRIIRISRVVRAIGEIRLFELLLSYNKISLGRNLPVAEYCTASI